MLFSDSVENNLEPLCIHSNITLYVTNITYSQYCLLHQTEFHIIVPDIECAYIPRQGASIVLHLALSLVGFA